MARVIDPSWIEIQDGLYLEEVDRVIAGQTYKRQFLHSAEGYCFYDNTWAEEERIYWQDASLGIGDSPDNYTSIKISDLPEGSEIAGHPGKPEIA